jgi:hypothetical protein
LDFVVIIPNNFKKQPEKSPKVLKNNVFAYIGLRKHSNNKNKYLNKP